MKTSCTIDKNTGDSKVNTPLIIPPKPDEHAGWCDECKNYSKRLKRVEETELNTCGGRQGIFVNACAACRYGVKVMTKKSAAYFFRKIGGIYDPGHGPLYTYCPRCRLKMEVTRGWARAETRKCHRDVVIEHLVNDCNHTEM